MKNGIICWIVFWVWLPVFTHAQYSAGMEALQAQQYSKAQGLFQQAGSKFPPLTHLGMARYFSTPGNPAFHLDSAYAGVLLGKQGYDRMDERKKEAVKKELGSDTPLRIKQAVEKLWLEQAIARKSRSELDRLLSVAKSMSTELKNAAKTLRDQLAFEEAAAQNTPAAYQQLLSLYGPSLRLTHPALFQKAGIALFDLYVREKGWAEQKGFDSYHPDAVFARDTVLDAFKAAVYGAARNRPEGWDRFARRFGGTIFETIGLDSLSGFCIQRGSWEQCERYLKAWPNGPRRDDVWGRLYQSYRSRQPDPSGLSSFVSRFPDFPFQERIRQDEAKALDFFYEATMRGDSTARAARFLLGYASYPKADSVWLRYYTLVRARAKKPRDVEIFLKSNPGMPSALREEALKEAREWEERLQQQAFDRLVAARHPTPLLRYATRQPPQRFAKEAQDKLVEVLLESDSLDAMRAFLKELPAHPGRKSILERLYMVTRANRSTESINAFALAYPDFDSVRLKVDRAASLIKELRGTYSDSRWELFSTYVKEYAPSDEAFFMLQKMMQNDFSSENWKGVADTLKQYQPFFAQKNEAFQEFYDRMLREDLAKKVSRIPWEDGQEYGGYSPVFSGDGKQLYFCRWLSESEDIYYSKYSEKGWSVPVAVSEINTESDHEAPEHISPNGTEMLVFVSGDIYESKKTANGWQTSQPLPAHINTDDWEGDSGYFRGGLIFVSDKDGNKDIYISLYGPDGRTLQPPFAIGDVINTNGTERKPFLHPDQKTLYFASDGHDGFGGLDIFVSTRLDDTWRNWSKPRNLGLSINSSADEWYFLVNTEGNRAYSVSDKGGRDHITSIDLPTAYRPQTVHTFETRVLGTDGKPIDGEVVIRDVESGNIVQIVRPDPLTGVVFIPVSGKKNYQAEILKADAPPISFQVNFAQDSVQNVTEPPVVVATTEELKRSGNSLRFQNLFFETGSYTILPESRTELDALAQYFKENALRVAIEGHTDDVGSPESNQLLSENRAAAVREYLIAKGCDPVKIKASGYGETRPTTPEQDEASRQKNRRVEFRLLE